MKFVNLAMTVFLALASQMANAEGTQPTGAQAVNTQPTNIQTPTQGSVAASNAQAIAATAGAIGRTFTAAVIVNATAIVISAAVTSSDEDGSDTNITTTTN
jgi:hypothetical protein